MKRVLTEEHRRNIAIANTGKKHSKETCLKMSLAKKENPTKYWLGKKRPDIGEKVSVKLKGRKLSIERRLQISKSSIRGSMHKWWKGGVNKITASIRHCAKYRIWRTKVFERDRYICTECGYDKGHTIQADHIKPFSTILRENNIKSLKDALKCGELWDIQNGRTLCRECHEKTPTFLNRKN